MLDDKLAIAVDMIGGDPVTVNGRTFSHLERACEAVSELSWELDDVIFHLFGPAKGIQDGLDLFASNPCNVTIHDCNRDFPMNGDIRKFRNVDTSISLMARGLKQGVIFRGESEGVRSFDVLYSSGHSGATVFFANHYAKSLGVLGAHGKTGRLKKLPPSLVSSIPCGIDRVFYLCDVGAIKDPEPLDLFISAMLTEVYARSMNGDSDVSVGLLDVPLAKSSEFYFGSLKSYVGVVSPEEAFNGKAKALSADGFSGNIALKVIEAVANGVMKRIKSVPSKEKFAPYFSPEYKVNPVFRTLENHSFVLVACDNPVDLVDRVAHALEDLDECDIPPNVGVLSNGEESEKGNAHARSLLEQLNKTRYSKVGFVEPVDLVSGFARRHEVVRGVDLSVTDRHVFSQVRDKSYSVDVVVTDSKTAKLYCEMVSAVERGLHDLVKSRYSLWNKIRYKLFGSGPLVELKELLDPDNHNGSAVLGINGYAVVGHGAASVKAIKSGIRYAVRYRESNYVDKAHASLVRMQSLFAQAKD